MIDHGSIEIIRGVGQNSSSEGKVFGPDDVFDENDAKDSVYRLTGYSIGSERDHEYGDTCVGVWSGEGPDGKQATIRVWRLDPE